MTYLEMRKCNLECQKFVMEAELNFLARFGGTIETANRHRVLTGVLDVVEQELQLINMQLLNAAELANAPKVLKEGSMAWFDHIIEVDSSQLKARRCVLKNRGVEIMCIIEYVSHRVGEDYPRMSLRVLADTPEHPYVHTIHRSSKQFKEEFVKWL